MHRSHTQRGGELTGLSDPALRVKQGDAFPGVREVGYVLESNESAQASRYDIEERESGSPDGLLVIHHSLAPVTQDIV